MNKDVCAEQYRTLPVISLTLEQQLLIERHLFDRYADTLSEFNGRLVVTPHNPYRSHLELREDIINGRFAVYSGGTYPVLSPIANLMFRFAHDWLHYYLVAPFTFEGEVDVFYREMVYVQNQYYGEDSRLLYNFYWSEIVGQAAVVETTGMFPEQRIVRAL